MSRQNRDFTLIAVIYCVYAALFILRTSFVIDGERYFSLFDDAMISMRYGKNLAEGHGLVWNPGGEHVEGYTNLLWTLWMSVLHLIPVAASKISLLVQLTSAFLLLCNLVLVKRIADAVSDASGFVWMGAVLATAFYLPLNNWALQGMEVGLLSVVVSLAAWKNIQAMRAGTFSAVPYVVLAVGMFVRPDIAIPYVVVLVFNCVTDRSNRPRHLLYGLLLLAAAAVSQTLFRVFYYGDALPNTYYLKLTGYPFLLRLSRGLYVTLVFIWGLDLVFFLVPLVLLIVGRKRSIILLLALFWGQLAYNAYVGGDAWESWGGSNRYVSIAMPAFFIAFFCGLKTIGDLVWKYVLPSLGGMNRERMSKYGSRAFTLSIVISLLVFNSINGPIALTELLLLKPVLHVTQNPKMVERGLISGAITSDQARIAVVWDGAIPYFANRYAVSILGKNDPRIARRSVKPVPGPEKLVAFYPGHMKWDYGYSIGQLRPDVVVQLWYDQDKAMPYLERDYMAVSIKGLTFELLKDSPNILWSRVYELAGK